jgi:hypothetical protein
MTLYIERVLEQLRIEQNYPEQEFHLTMISVAICLALILLVT